MKKILLFALFACALAACNKTEDILIKDNVPPPDHTIDSNTIQIYVNKAYINILGREPLASEKSAGVALLNNNNFSQADRKTFIQSLLAKSDYNRNQYNIARVEYLQNLDSTEIEGQLYLFQLLLSQPQYAPFYDLLNAEVARLNELKATVNDMNAGTLDYRGMLKRCVNNYFYDQINMGTENFVVSTFQNFFFRYPTTAELTNGKLIVDGVSATLFLQIGKSKGDYINIFFGTDDFYEGQVRNIFKKYLLREPSPAEINYYAGVYKSNNSFKKLQEEVFSLDEYAGVK
ncbi:MAG: hypothetical protein KIS94_02610 [Chitinophagales bacterium]|nr:hypothetical protein [Chitinophagales bacterium]